MSTIHPGGAGNARRCHGRVRSHPYAAFHPRLHADPVTAGQVETLLRAAMAAPSAGNAQPWHFVVVDDRALLDQLAEVLPYAKMLKQAPVGIVVLSDPSLEKYPGYWPQDCSAALQNLLLAARGLGLGAVWTGAYPMGDRMRDIRRVLNVPEPVIPLAVVPVGVPAQESKRVERFRAERVHRNGW